MAAGSTSDTPISPAVTCHSLESGLRLVHVLLPGLPVAYCGAAVRVGSRDEAPDCPGLAHFVEHTIFKGTARRSSWNILNSMEAVGGELNAYTTKEETVVYSVFPGADPSRAADLIADLVHHSVFPTRELDKERDVVADEIDSYLDSPADAVFDDYEDMLFAGSPLGHNILGTREALAGFTSETCRNFLEKHYTAANMVVFYGGSMPAGRVFNILERMFGNLRPGTPAAVAPAPPKVEPFNAVRHVDTHQCHTIVGTRIGGLAALDRYATALLVNILGGPGMNSLLNVALRERRGLVYSVEASTGLFSDCGVLAIYYGCDPADNDRCRRLVTSTVSRIADGLITPVRLAKAKKQFLGQLTVGSTALESRVTGIAHATLFCGRAATAAEIADAINAVGCDTLRTAAAALLPLSSLTLCPR